MATLRKILRQNVREGEFYEKLDDKKIRCFACGHRCPSRMAGRGVAKSDSTEVARSTFPGVTRGACSATRLRKSLSSMPIPRLWPIVLGCWAVICTVLTAKIG